MDTVGRPRKLEFMFASSVFVDRCFDLVTSLVLCIYSPQLAAMYHATRVIKAQ